jgi:hypothetical protein
MKRSEMNGWWDWPNWAGLDRHNWKWTGWMRWNGMGDAEPKDRGVHEGKDGENTIKHMQSRSKGTKKPNKQTNNHKNKNAAKPAHKKKHNRITAKTRSKIKEASKGQQ